MTVWLLGCLQFGKVKHWEHRLQSCPSYGFTPFVERVSLWADVSANKPK
jgi:hypothetical protein